MRDKRILVADDNTDMAETLGDILRYLGYEVVQVETGTSALREVERTTFDLVLLDLQMPQVDGLATFRWIQAVQPDMPVLLMTAWSQSEKLQQARQAGISGILPKPFDPQYLIEEIQRLTEAKHPSLRLLIVDDEPELGIMLKRQLGRHEHEVDTALTGREAIEKATHQTYDVVFLDVCLPDINGLEVYAGIRRVQPEVIGIMMTGYRNEPSVRQLLREARRHGCACLEKPFPMRDALSLMDQISRD